MLRSWPTKIPNMNKMQQNPNDYLCTQYVRMDVWSNKHEKGYYSRQNQPSVKSVYINMCMLRLWPTKIPNMSKMQQKTNN